MITRKQWWETCVPRWAHLEPREYDLAEFPFGFKNKVVVDYGIGGGWFGKALFDQGIKKYIGIDIADRSIKKAKETLKGYNCEFLKAPCSLDIGADILISLACIQHFTEDYFYYFLTELNISGIPILGLQIRRGKLKFDPQNVIYSCYAEPNNLSEILKNYTLVSVSKTYKENNYQYLRFSLNDIQL